VPRYDLYVIDVDCGRNCYSCRKFGHIARNCRNRRIIEQEKRVDYKDKRHSNLNKEESLVVSY